MLKSPKSLKYMNKEENGTNVVVTSALWNMDPAISHAVARVKAGTFSAEDYRDFTMMAKGGSSLAPYYEFASKIPADIQPRVDEAAAAIISGDMVVEIDDSEPKSTF